MPSLTVIDEPVKFHMAVNVSDLDRAVAFYRVFFGAEPAKCRPDYAKFELDDPPVVFSLAPLGTGAGGPMSHAGLRLATEDAVLAAKARLEAAGIPTRTQTDTRGCYAVQTKIWVSDPDKTLWEVYVLKADIPFGDVTDGPECVPPPADGGDRAVLYRGPLRELLDDAGRRFPRGGRVALPAAAWEELRRGPAAGQFVFLDAATGGCR